MRSGSGQHQRGPGRIQENKGPSRLTRTLIKYLSRHKWLMSFIQTLSILPPTILNHGPNIQGNTAGAQHNVIDRAICAQYDITVWACHWFHSVHSTRENMKDPGKPYPIKISFVLLLVTHNTNFSSISVSRNITISYTQHTKWSCNNGFVFTQYINN